MVVLIGGHQTADQYADSKEDIPAKLWYYNVAVFHNEQIHKKYNKWFAKIRKLRCLYGNLLFPCQYLHSIAHNVDQRRIQQKHQCHLQLRALLPADIKNFNN